nr:hypothetical protein MERC5_00033 [uncultured bacterium]
MPIDPCLNLTDLAELERLAQRCTDSIAQCLEPGMTEEAVASLMRQWLRQHGVSDALHRPLAWFGERTRLPALPSRPSLTRLRPVYFPTSAKLEAGQAFTLYCAPRAGELVAEAVRCGSLGSHPGYQQLQLKVAHIKALLLQAVNQQQSLTELTQLMEQLAQAQNASLCQSGIGGSWIRPYSSSPELGQNHQGLMEKVVDLTGNQAPAHLPDSPLHLSTDAPLTPGLWIIQPWLDSGSLGAGMRALLYIAPQGKACWLNLPHTQTKAA